MKKNILKSLEPQTRSLFRFKNSDTKFKAAVIKAAPTAGDNGDSDPTISTTIFVTH